MTTPGGVNPRQVVEQLRHSEERFRLLVESATDYAIFMLDPAGRVASWNVGAQRIKGYRADEVVGRHFSQFYPPEEAARGRPAAALETAAAEGRAEDEGWRVRKDGSRFWANVIVTALRDDAGRLRGFGKVVRDLTERRLAEAHVRESEARLQAFMNHSPSILFIKDLQGRYQYVNDQFTRFFGLRPGTVLSRTDAELLPPQAAEQFRANDAQVIEAGEAIEFEETASQGDDVRVNLVCKFPIRDQAGRITGLGGIVTDITARKRAEQQVEALNRDLEQRISQVESVQQELEGLIRVVSRDLRPPLRSMETLARQVAEQMADTAGLVNRLDEVGRTASKLGDLTGDLLIYSRCNSAVLKRSAVDLNLCVADIRRHLYERSQPRRIDWRIGELPVVAGDASLLRLAFENLLSNAVKFTRWSDVAIIEVDQLPREGGTAVVRVKDNGAGFDPGRAHALFGALQRLHDGEEYAGTGVGLATVKRIVDRHRGRVWAESQPGRGACFYVELERAAAPSKARTVLSADPPALERNC